MARLDTSTERRKSETRLKGISLLVLVLLVLALRGGMDFLQPRLDRGNQAVSVGEVEPKDTGKETMSTSEPATEIFLTVPSIPGPGLHQVYVVKWRQLAKRFFPADLPSIPDTPTFFQSTGTNSDVYSRSRQ